MVHKFYAAGITSKIFAIVAHTKPACTLREIIGMRPEIVFVIALHITAIAGKNEIAHINIAIIIGIIF